MLQVFFGNIQLVKNPQVFAYWFSKMDEVRQGKIVACKGKEDQQRSLLAGILLQQGMARISMEKACYHSISHSGEYVACVIADCPVGIDVENKFRSVFAKDKGLQRERIAKKCFSKEELLKYMQLPETQKTKVLLYIWTRKESYSKALGKGLAIDFSAIDTLGMERNYWSHWLKEGYYCSVYVENGDFSDMKLQEIFTL